jgi:galactitol PTS system EIIA component
VDLRSLLADDLIRLSCYATTWEEVLRRLAADLYAAERARPSYEDAVVARERVYPTGLEVGDLCVAIPHADVQHVIAPAIAIATLSSPVMFGEMGNPGRSLPVQVVFMLAIHEAEAMVGVLQELVTVFQRPGVLRAILSAREKSEVRTAVENALGQHPPDTETA